MATSPNKGDNKMLIKEHQVSVIVHLFLFLYLVLCKHFQLIQVLKIGKVYIRVSLTPSKWKISEDLWKTPHSDSNST